MSCGICKNSIDSVLSTCKRTKTSCELNAYCVMFPSTSSMYIVCHCQLSTLHSSHPEQVTKHARIWTSLDYFCIFFIKSNIDKHRRYSLLFLNFSSHGLRHEVWGLLLVLSALAWLKDGKYLGWWWPCRLAFGVVRSQRCEKEGISYRYCRANETLSSRRTREISTRA